MRPRQVVYETLQKLGSDDATPGAAPADVLDIGGIAVDLAVVTLGERQPPDSLADCFTSLAQPVGELVVVRKQACPMMTQRDDDRARQGRQIDYQARLEAMLTIPQRVGQHQPALGVSVQGLDGLTGHRSDD